MSTTSSHQHPAVGDTYKRKNYSGNAANILYINDGWVLLRRKHAPPFVISQVALMSSGNWKNQCPTCFPPETQPATLAE